MAEYVRIRQLVDDIVVSSSKILPKDVALQYVKSFEDRATRQNLRTTKFKDGSLVIYSKENVIKYVLLPSEAPVLKPLSEQFPPVKPPKKDELLVRQVRTVLSCHLGGTEIHREEFAKPSSGVLQLDRLEAMLKIRTAKMLRRSDEINIVIKGVRVGAVDAKSTVTRVSRTYLSVTQPAGPEFAIRLAFED